VLKWQDNNETGVGKKVNITLNLKSYMHNFKLDLV